jgi:addiction module HigA family antidote
MTIRKEELDQIDFSDTTSLDAARLPLVHPGDILLHDFMEPLGLSANALSKALKVPPNRITAIINHQRGITGDTALRLERHFGMSAEFWLSVQKDYELDKAKRELSAKIENEVTPRAA